jgi:hypothetical protein
VNEKWSFFGGFVLKLAIFVEWSQKMAVRRGWSDKSGQFLWNDIKNGSSEGSE